jgi:hypothetical protein
MTIHVCWQHCMPLSVFRVEEMSFMYVRWPYIFNRKSRKAHMQEVCVRFIASLCRPVHGFMAVSFDRLYRYFTLAFRTLSINLKPCKLADFTLDGVSSLFSRKIAGAWSVITLLLCGVLWGSAYSVRKLREGPDRITPRHVINILFLGMEECL